MKKKLIQSFILYFSLLFTMPAFGGDQKSDSIFDAISNDDPKRVEELLDRNLKLIEERGEQQGRYGYTPLLFVANDNFGKHGLEIVKILLSKGADLEAKDNSGRTALSGIVSSPANPETGLKIAQALIDKGANINTADQNGYTPLMLAWTGDAASLLIRNKANIDQVDSWGRTALMVNAMHSDIESDQVKVLVEAGASLEKRDPEGKRALEFAKERGLDDRAYEHQKQWEAIVYLEKAMHLPLDKLTDLFPGIKDPSDPKTVALLKKPARKALVGKWVMTGENVNGTEQPPVGARWMHQDSGEMGCNIFSIAQVEFDEDGQSVIDDEFKAAFKVFADDPSKVQFKTRDCNRGFVRDSYSGGTYTAKVTEIDGVKTLRLTPDRVEDDLTPKAEYRYVQQKDLGKKETGSIFVQ